MKTKDGYIVEISRDEIEQLIKTGTPLQRVMLIEAHDLSVSPTMSGDEDPELLSYEDMKRLVDVHNKKEREHLAQLFSLLANMIKRKAIAEVQYIKLKAIALSCNNALKEIDIYTMEVQMMNNLLSVLGDNDEAKKILMQHHSIDSKLVTIKYNEKSGQFELEASSLKKMLRRAYKQMKELLHDQKKLEYWLYQYAEHYNATHLVPRSLLRYIDASKQDWALNKRFSSKHYNEIVKGGLPERLMAMAMEDRGDTEWFLPHWDDVKLTKKDKDKTQNYFFNG